MSALNDQLAEAAVPPYSISAEQGVIGGLMLDPVTAWAKVQGIVTAGDFYRRDHHLIFKAIALLHGMGEPVDVITVYELLKSKGYEEQTGGLFYLGVMAKDTPSAANVGHYAGIVRDKSALRQLIMVSGMIREMAFAPDADAKVVISKAETLIFNLAQQTTFGNEGFSIIKDILADVMDEIDSTMERPEDGVFGVSSGFLPLDDLTSGFNGGDLVVVAGRPSMGKTSLAMNIAETAAISGKTVAVFSMEMKGVQLGQRLLSTASNLPLKLIREGWRVGENDWPKLSAGIIKIRDLSLYVDASAALTAGDIRSRCMKLNSEIKAEVGDDIGLIVIDYLQLMSSDIDHKDNDTIKFTEITRNLKRLAMDFDVPVLLLSQLNRNLDSRPNKRPVLSDLRGSGSIEQDADLVLFIYRDDVYNPDSIDKGVAEIIVGKQRNGALGTVKLLFDAALTRFRTFDGGGDDYYR